jgi:hypothetical protein
LFRLPRRELAASEVFKRLITRKRSSPPPKPAKQFPLSKKDGKYFDVPDGIIADLARGCCGNLHDSQVVEVGSTWFENETDEANPHSNAYGDGGDLAAKNARDLETDSLFYSACRGSRDCIPHRGNNWECCDFKERLDATPGQSLSVTWGQMGLQIRIRSQGTLPFGAGIEIPLSGSALA